MLELVCRVIRMFDERKMSNAVYKIYKTLDSKSFKGSFSTFLFYSIYFYIPPLSSTLFHAFFGGMFFFFSFPSMFPGLRC